MFSGLKSYLDVVLVGISFYSGFCGYSIGYYYGQFSDPIGLREWDPIGLREWDPIGFLL